MEERLDELDRLPLEELEELAASYGVKRDYSKVGEGVYRLRDRELTPGWLAPSMFVAYYRCARRLWLEFHEGARLVTADELRWILRGRIAERMWAEEHPGFLYQVELEDPEDRVRGIIDALRVDGDKIVVVEVKSSHRIKLGAQLQAMTYVELVKKAVRGLGKAVEGYLVYRHGVRRVEVNEELLRRYRKRVEAAISHRLPPPPLPDRRYCNVCPWRSKCQSLPKMDWDEWLISIGDYPKGPQCRDCQYVSFCRAFRASVGRYPCESEQKPLLPNRELVEAVLKA